jgi:putative DNA-invertase from lambdoid prophage Rac
VLAFAFSLSAEIERQLISQTKEGLNRARAEGKKIGRPQGSYQLNEKLLEHDKEISKLLSKNVSKSAIARLFGVSRNTLLRHLAKKASNEVAAMIRGATA